MKIRSHAESHADLVVVEAAKDDVGSHLLVGVGEKVRVIPEGESWPMREAKDVLKGG